MMSSPTWDRSSACKSRISRAIGGSGVDVTSRMLRACMMTTPPLNGCGSSALEGRRNVPLFTEVCEAQGCILQGDLADEYYRHWDDPQKPCSACGGPTVRQFSPFASPFMGEMSRKYVDTSLDDGQRQDLGHWAWRRKSSVSGKPEPVYIHDWAQQRAFCKAEGLANPTTEMDSNCEVSEDGSKFQKATATLADLKELEKKSVAQEANPA
jgi:hypothetical protein